VINNAAIQNVSTGYTAEAYEMGLNGGTFQGNVAEATTGGVGWGAYYCGISTQPGVVNKLENNIFCGPEGVYGTSLPTADSYFTTTTNYKGGGFHEPWDLATYEASANYYPGLICPDSAHMTTSNMVMGFVSANNQSLGGGTGTWSVYVTSMLPVRNVSFYVDGSRASRRELGLRNHSSMVVPRDVQHEFVVRGIAHDQSGGDGCDENYSDRKSDFFALTRSKKSA
jgi:hypothetical protein